MNKIKTFLTLLTAAALVLSCSKDDDDTVVPVVVDDVDTVHVAVILPEYIRLEWENSIGWALKNIERAQNNLKQKFVLQLHYYDEDKERLDRLGYRLVHPGENGDDSCVAIIGPYHSYNAQTILNYAAQYRTPVVMPTCTSAELQRVHARNTYAWFLTESDVTQCEVMLQAIKTMQMDEVALLYSDDTYGKSFYDWFGYWAVELGLDAVGGAGTVFKSGDDLTPFFSEIDKNSEKGTAALCMAFSNHEDYIDACKQLSDYEKNSGYKVFVYPFFTDVAMTTEVINSKAFYPVLGICPIGSMDYAFPQAYYQMFGHLPNTGEAQVYDALSLIALGAALQKASPDRCIVKGKRVYYDTEPYDPGLTDYMRSVVSSSSGEHTMWTDAGLATAFAELGQGRDIDCEGATGGLVFDAATSTKLSETLYMLWSIAERESTDDIVSKLEPICYLSTSGSSGSTSTSIIWEQTKRYQQQFQPDLVVNHDLPKATSNWAVVISPSTTWANYRHQADAFAMYQTLRHHGYDDDHIVLIVQDNLAFDEHNKFPGHIYVERSDDPTVSDIFINDDVRNHAVVDYHFSDLTPDDVVDIMLGRQSEHLPRVIHPDSASNVFFFWSGHGGSYEGPLWGNENAREYFGTKRLRAMVEEMNNANMYRRLMFSIETCFSGKWGEALTGLPDVLVLTAANSIETSKADVHDTTLGVFLSNAFSRTFRKFINDNNDITLHSLYTALAKTTNGSHVSIYNEQNYGSVFTNSMSDYMPE